MTSAFDISLHRKVENLQVIVFVLGIIVVIMASAILYPYFAGTAPKPAPALAASGHPALFIWNNTKLVNDTVAIYRYYSNNVTSSDGRITTNTTVILTQIDLGEIIKLTPGFSGFLSHANYTTGLQIELKLYNYTAFPHISGNAAYNCIGPQRAPQDGPSCLVKSSPPTYCHIDMNSTYGNFTDCWIFGAIPNGQYLITIKPLVPSPPDNSYHVCVTGGCPSQEVAA